MECIQGPSVSLYSNFDATSMHEMTLRIVKYGFEITRVWRENSGTTEIAIVMDFCAAHRWEKDVPEKWPLVALFSGNIDFCSQIIDHRAIYRPGTILLGPSIIDFMVELISNWDGASRPTIEPAGLRIHDREINILVSGR